MRTSIPKRQSDQSRILIIDDSKINQGLLASQLARNAYEITSADNGVEGIELARHTQPDLILLDILMPGMDGFEVCRHIKSDPATAHIPIIIITSLSDVAHRMRGIEAGANEFIVRSYHVNELIIRMDVLLQLKQTREKLVSERQMLQLLYDVSQVITTQLDLKSVMIDIITTTKAALGATVGNIILLDDNGSPTHKILLREDATNKISRQVSDEVMSQGFAGWLMRNQTASIITDTQRDQRWIVLSDDKDVIRSVIGVPLATPLRLMGMLILAHPEPDFFHTEHLELTIAVGRQVTSAIQNAYLFTQVDDERRKLSAILAQSSEVIITTDEKEQITLLNKSAERLFGVKLDTVINRNIHAIEELAPVARLFAHAQTSKFSAEIPFGDESYLLATVAPIINVGYLAVMQDITQIKLAEAQRLRTERIEKERIKRALNRYISPALLDDVLAENVDVFRNRSRQFAVVLFADLRNSTELVVKLPPDQTINLLNEFFDAMTTVVYEHEGTIFDLIGDELEIGFNVPLSQPDAVQRAFMTAVAMQQLFQEKANSWYEWSGVILSLGIGIEMGYVVLGNVGARSRMHYAMVGRAVNVAHRLVDLAENGQIVVSKNVYDALHDEASELIEKAGLASNEHFILKGTTEMFDVYRFEQPVSQVLDTDHSTEVAYAASQPDVDSVEESV